MPFHLPAFVPSEDGARCEPEQLRYKRVETVDQLTPALGGFYVFGGSLFEDIDGLRITR